MVQATRAGARLGGYLVAIVAIAWGCGGTTVSFVPDASGGGDGSASSSGSSSGIGSSSSGVSGGTSSGNSASGSGSSGGNSSGSGSGSGNGSGSGSGSTSSSGGSGSGSSSGFSGSTSGSGGSSGSSGSSSGGFSCGNCTSDQQCQAACPPVQGGGTNCCDQGSGVCYATTNPTCPVPADASCPSGGPICAPNDAGNTPPNPNTGTTACDDCIECSCGPAWCACMGDTGFDDAGSFTGCLGYTNCVVDCLNGDSGGGAQQCAQGCSANYSVQQVQQGNALLTCLSNSCATPTTCN